MALVDLFQSTMMTPSEYKVHFTTYNRMFVPSDMTQCMRPEFGDEDDYDELLHDKLRY